MGAEESEIPEDLSEQLQQMCDTFSVEYDALEQLAKHFQQVYGDQMTRDQFVEACGFGGLRDALARRLFDSLPSGGGPLGVIDFIQTILVLGGRGDDPDTKASLVFKLYDSNGDGFLDEKDLRTVTSELLEDMRDTIEGVDMDTAIDEAVQSTLIAAETDRISLDHFLTMARNNEWLTSPIQIDGDRLIAFFNSRE